MVSTQIVTLNRLLKQATSFRRNAGDIEGQGAGLHMMQTRMKVIKMLLVVIATFIICWTPDEVNFFIANLTPMKYEYFETKNYHIFVSLAFLNSCVNPFIFVASNSQFREALFRLLRLNKRNTSEPDTRPSADMCKVSAPEPETRLSMDIINA